jgi:16S rRNA (adenine1518-N6/adenine1519-N6)-dimethyltransferase
MKTSIRFSLGNQNLLSNDTTRNVPDEKVMQINAFHAQEILRNSGFRPSKRRGQHFIVDPDIAKRQVDYASLRPEELVLEIGSGLGALTETIASRGNRLVTIEVDDRLVRILKPRLAEMRNVALVKADALSPCLGRIDKIISNIPYNISSQITFKILELEFDTAVLTYQIDFARRMIAQPGSKDYSRLSVNVYYRAEAEVVETIRRDVFYPTPSVDSAIIKLRRRPPPFHVDNEQLFFKLLRELFPYRNQHLRKVLKRFAELNQLKAFDTVKIIEEADVKDERIRDLTADSFGKLSDSIHRRISSLATP